MEESVLLDDLFIKLLCVQAKFNKNMEDLARSMKLNKSELLVLFDVLKHPLTSLNEICQRTGIKKVMVQELLIN